MESLDRNMEQRVWKRVTAREEPNMPALQRENLKGLILEAQENAAAYRGLALQLIGKPWESLRRLENESMRQVYSLRGISALKGEWVKLNPCPQQRDQPRRTLEKCFRRHQRLWEEMDRRCSDPEFGMVFRKLRLQAEVQCAAAAELLGKLDCPA